MSNNTETSKRIDHYIESIQRFEKKRYELTQEIRKIKKDAKARGYDLPKIIRLRLAEEQARKDKEALLKTYAEADGQSPNGKI